MFDWLHGLQTGLESHFGHPSSIMYSDKKWSWTGQASTVNLKDVPKQKQNKITFAKCTGKSTSIKNMAIGKAGRKEID